MGDRATEAQLKLAFEQGGVVFVEIQPIGWAVALEQQSKAMPAKV